MANTRRDVKAWEVDWTRRHINSLTIGGIWAIPRSGIIFTRTGEKEVTLTSVIPFMAEMARVLMGDGSKMSPAALTAQQQEEFFNVAARLRAGGFTVKTTVPEIKETEE